MTKLLLIAVGGSFGAVLRYLVAGWGQRLTSGSFPLGTLLVNLAGCLLMGFLVGVLTGPLIVREEYRLALLVGFIGSFTTFSTFGYETLALLHDREWGGAALNVVASNVVGIGAVLAGLRLAERWQGA
ncbi:MAG: fluoride efflux transporter CrcB [Myxococcota bacterium]|nr:fluoride efflux transporter CrcB [Myxococcota bacterium]